ncbi:isochorismatase family protein [Actinomadura sp. 9N407]|uniref:isochorismatase family protein n=1 Tax=Actinomadura sp. 9N407 TaxID=3375154 RepID=UPI00378D501A
MTDWIEETRDRYAARGIGGRLSGRTRPAVVVIDLIDGFTDPACPPGTDLDAVVGATAALLERARAAELPIFFTTIAYEPEDLERLVWLRKMPALRALEAGSRWVRVDSRLAAREPVIVKKAASGFHGTDLGERLAAAGADSLIVCGATTSGCVRATVIDACALNYPVFVPRECVGDREPGPHEANLLDIDAKYADVVAAAEVVAAW